MGRTKHFLVEGQQIGRLTIIKEARVGLKRGILCKCECGNEKIFQASSLFRKNNPPTSCGCFRPNRVDPGQVFGRLTVISLADRPKGSRQAHWNVKCECGTSFTCTAGILIKTGKTPCTCESYTPQKLDYYNEKLVGKTFHDLTVLRFDRVQSGQYYYFYQCKCGYEGSISVHLFGKQKSCGCIYRRASFKGYEEITGQYWSGVRKNAISRKLEFSITLEYAWEVFLKQNRRCVFTGRQLYFGNRTKSRWAEATASLDRIDAHKGYIVGNIQWTYKTVNQCKWQLNNEEFIGFCQEVVDYQKQQKGV